MDSKCDIMIQVQVYMGMGMGMGKVFYSLTASKHMVPGIDTLV